LQISRRFAPLIVLAVLIALKLPPLSAMIPLYGHAYTSGFIAGVGVFYAWRGFDALARRRFKALAPPTFAFVFVASAGYLAAATYQASMIPAVIFPALLVLSALMLHSLGVRVGARWVLLLGDASYALYLFHADVIETMRAMSATLPWLDFTRHAAAAFAALVLSCLLAVAIHLRIEKPLLRRLRRWSKGGYEKDRRALPLRVVGRPALLEAPDANHVPDIQLDNS
jgi:exopolysaccharide production protein ExoZ